jgi:hypothetical protein
MPIVNGKNISTTGFDQDVLIITEPGTTLFNFGDLTTTGDLANGIFADANNVSIRNNARIETSGLGAAGIYVEGANAHIENFGSIVTHGDFYDPNSKVDGDEFFPEGIFANGDGFYIANYGIIHVEAGSASGMVGIGVNGVVTNAGDIESTAEAGVVMFAIGDGCQAINTGQATATGEGITAMIVRGEGVAAVNQGGLTVTGDDGAGMISQLRDGHLTNHGVIQITGDNSFGMLGAGDEMQIDNFGNVETHGTRAIGIDGTGGRFFPNAHDTHILNSGHVTTEGDLAVGVALGLTVPGVVRTAIASSIVNTGVIETKGDGATGVVMIGDGHHLTNSGAITTNGDAFEDETVGLLHAAGVVVSGDGVLVENTETGVIRSENADSAAVELNVLKRSGLANGGTSSLVENTGLIEGAKVAILGGDGQETVVNHGHIVGDVILGQGADTFVFGSSGSLDGNLFLGGGKDLVVIENGAGTAKIADFAAGSSNKDVIDVSAFFSSFSDLKAHTKQSGNDVIINLDQNDVLILGNIQLNSLNTGDFIFGALV